MPSFDDAHKFACANCSQQAWIGLKDGSNCCLSSLALIQLASLHFEELAAAGNVPSSALPASIVLPMLSGELPFVVPLASVALMCPPWSGLAAPPETSPDPSDTLESLPDRISGAPGSWMDEGTDMVMSMS